MGFISLPYGSEFTIRKTSNSYFCTMNGKKEILFTQAWNGLIGPILLNGNILLVKNCSRLLFWSNNCCNCLKKEKKRYPGLLFHTFTRPQNSTFDPLDWRLVPYSIRSCSAWLRTCSFWPAWLPQGRCKQCKWPHHRD